VGPVAPTAGVPIPAALLFTPAIIIAVTDLLLRPSGLLRRGRLQCHVMDWAWRAARKPPKHREVRIPRVVGSSVVILQAEAASWDGPGPPCESLIIEARIGQQPVEVLACQRFPAELAIISNPSLAPVVSLGSDNCGLVGKWFWGLIRKPGG